MQVRSFAVQVISACCSLGLMLAVPTAAHADAFTLFDVNLQLANGGTVTGTLDLDESPGAGLSSVGNLSYGMNGIVQASFTGQPFGGTFTLFSPYINGISFSDDGGVGSYDLAIDLPVTTFESFAGFTGGAVCSTSIVCQEVFPIDSQLFSDHDGHTISYVTSGDLTPASAAVTPEPSSFVLLGTGVLGVSGALRKRYMGA